MSEPATRGLPEPVGWRSASLALLTAALWGGTPVAISYSVDTVPPLTVAAVRFALASAFMLFWCRLEGSSLQLLPGQFKPAFIAGTLLFAQIALFHVGVEKSSSSHTTLIINSFIFWVILIEHFITKADRLSPRKIGGILIAACGLMLIVSKPNRSESQQSSSVADLPTLTGDLILFASALLLGIKIVYTKHALKVVEPGKLILWHDVIGTTMLAASGLVLEEVEWGGYTRPAVIGLVYQGVVVAGFCFAIQALLLRRHSASQIAVFSFTTPLFGVSLAVFFRGDPFTPWLLLAGGCIAIGILIVTTEQSHEQSGVSGI